MAGKEGIFVILDVGKSMKKKIFRHRRDST
jgi:hypothetical protein